MEICRRCGSDFDPVAHAGRWTCRTHPNPPTCCARPTQWSRQWDADVPTPGCTPVDHHVTAVPHQYVVLGRPLGVPVRRTPTGGGTTVLSSTAPDALRRSFDALEPGLGDRILYTFALTYAGAAFRGTLTAQERAHLDRAVAARRCQLEAGARSGLAWRPRAAVLAADEHDAADAATVSTTTATIDVSDRVLIETAVRAGHLVAADVLRTSHCSAAAPSLAAI